MAVAAESVQVIGVGKIDVRPNADVLDLGAEAWAGTVGQAVADASAVVSVMLQTLRAAGCTDQDLRTEGPMTYTRAFAG